MKIKKFNEQIDLRNKQKEEILEIFIDKIDDDLIYHDTNDDTEQFILFHLYFDEKTKMSNLEDVKIIKNFYSERIEIFNDLEMQLNRLNDLGYEWEMEEDNHQLFITVWFNDIEETIENAFGTKERIFINEPIMKKVLKNNYNLTYMGYYHIKGGPGRYGSDNSYNIYIQEDVDNETLFKIEKDLKSIKDNIFTSVNKSKYLSYDGKYDKYILEVDYSY